jgi:hypothetical protein
MTTLEMRKGVALPGTQGNRQTDNTSILTRRCWFCPHVENAGHTFPASSGAARPPRRRRPARGAPRSPGASPWSRPPCSCRRDRPCRRCWRPAARAPEGKAEGPDLSHGLLDPRLRDVAEDEVLSPGEAALAAPRLGEVGEAEHGLAVHEPQVDGETGVEEAPLPLGMNPRMVVLFLGSGRHRAVPRAGGPAAPPRGRGRPRALGR